MNKFDLSLYKDSKPYFDLYDVYIKDKGIRKEVFLMDIGVTPSSYRKCRKGELNIGFEIVTIISNHFKFNIPQLDFYEELELFINKIYFDMYYKNYKSYQDDVSYINQLLESNTLIFPIIKLLKLFMISASNGNINDIRNNYYELFKDVEKYESYFKYGLYELYEIVYLVFTDNISKNHWIKNYTNGMSYFILATRSYLEGRYIESLFYGEKCKAKLFEDGNINRLFYLNNTLMSSLIYVENYEECYDVSSKQIASLDSINYKEQFLFLMSKKFKILSLLGMRKFQQIKREYWYSEDMTLTELVSMLIALYYLNIGEKRFEEYEQYYKELEVDSLPEEYSIPIMLVNELLKNKSKAKKIIPTLKNYEIMPQLEKILQNIVL